jgi:hypothetical protein
MLSAFQSREFGFGLELSKEHLEEVNYMRRGKKYQDEEAAKKIRGKSDKNPLESSPFIVEFDYGVANEGYWCYERMVLQMEDCADVLHTLYPQFDFLFLFDHSCGHDKQQPDGLNAENMAKSYGGKQNYLRPTIIKQEKDYLGPYPRTLRVGDTQFMVFQPGDSGPFWLSEAKREEFRLDKLIDGRTTKRKYTKNELTTRLQERGIAGGGTLKRLQQLCEANQIPIMEETQKVQQGWGGETKRPFTGFVGAWMD